MNHLSCTGLFRWVTLVVLSLVAVGCSTHNETITYYRPYEAVGMKVTSGSGPDNQARFEFEEHDIRLMVVAQPSYEPPRIWVNMHLPKGKEMTVVGDHFTITPRGQADAYDTPISYIRGIFLTDGEWIYRDFKPGDELHGADQETVSHFWGSRTTLPRQYEIVAPLGDQLPEVFELLLPEMQIEGQTVKMPSITFFKKTGVFRVKNNLTLHPW